MIQNVLIDMDGVIANFYKQACEDLCIPRDKQEWNLENWKVRNHSMSEQLGMKDNEFWERINCNHDFWLNIPEYEYSQELVKWIQARYPLYICTKPNSDPKCCAAKVMWIKKHFPSLRRKFAVTPCKWLLANPTTILIDDADENCESFVKAGGQVIVFPQPWNTNFENWKRPLEYVKEFFDVSKF